MLARRSQRRRPSIRLRTTLAAVCVVAAALLVGALTLASLMAYSLQDGLETTADQQIAALSRDLPPTAEPTRDSDSDDLGDVVWQIFSSDHQLLASSQPLPTNLPIDDDTQRLKLSGSHHSFLVVSKKVTGHEGSYYIVVALSREPITDALDALVLPLSIGIPTLIFVVALTTWLVVGKALKPVESIRREVAQISDHDLDRRVPQPDTGDEVSRLAATMNQMLDRLEKAQQRQRQFVADASHELRSPLASIKQYVEVAKLHPDAVPPGELVDAVLEESTRMQALITQLLMLARLDDGELGLKLVDVDLDDLAFEAAARARLAGFEIDTRGVKAARVQADPLSLRQVIDNLVDNACRFAKHTVAISITEHNGTVKLVVDDDGPGIPEADRTRIFERFIRLDSARSRQTGGTGLGLAIVRELLAHHDGTVSVADSPTGGARFVVCLATS